MQIATHGILASSASAAASFSNVKSLVFDGVDDYVQLTSATNLRPTESELNASGYTVSMWVKRNNTGTSGLFANDGVGQTTYYGLEFYVKSNGTLGMQKLDGQGTGSSDRSTAVTSSGAISVGSWAHVLFVLPTANKSAWKIYVNGVSQTLTTSGTGGNVGYLNGTAAIGAIRTGKFFKDNLDEVAVWNSDQSFNVATIYNSGSPADLTSLSPVSWWRNGDGDTFPTLTDNGSGSNNGTMTNMTSGDIVTDVP